METRLPDLDRAEALWRALLQPIVETSLAIDAKGSVDGAHDLAHILRVWSNCQAIARGEPACDVDVLIASAFLHDIVSLPKNHPERHQASRVAAKRALEHLTTIGFPQEKFGDVRHAIEAHSFSAGIKPETAEARILQDADRLDALGAIGIARTFYVGGKMGSELVHSADPSAKLRELDDKRYAFDHFATKLFVIADTMTTSTGAQLARARTEAMRQFCDQLVAEING